MQLSKITDNAGDIEDSILPIYLIFLKARSRKAAWVSV